ncbi:MAG TPA: hypothetical protein VMW08_07060 [Acidimicrobiales bacterium]|nr:hypothetical protein [Acidimicrobiales bacterium]
MAALIAMIAACGADEPEVGDGTSASISDDSGGDDALTEYCEYVTSLDQGLVYPTDDQWDRLAELSPSEIADEAQVVAEMAKRVDEGFEITYGEEGPPDFWGAALTIEAFQEENCGVKFPDDIDLSPEATPEEE